MAKHPNSDRLTGTFKDKVTLNGISDRNATTVIVAFGDIKVTGASKRNKGEVYSFKTGGYLATAEALEKLAALMRAEVLADEEPEAEPKPVLAQNIVPAKTAHSPAWLAALAKIVH